ncbi:MAG: F0F1 ATP synthase subunit A [Fibrobacter sp.]|nr:F0F1 ATP synthase subunit A [Fibrobacter sp.]
MKIIILTILLALSSISAEQDFAEFINHHVTNTEQWSIGSLSLDLSKFQLVYKGIHFGPTLDVMMLFIAGLLAFFSLKAAAKRKNDQPTSKWGQAIEVVIDFLKQDFILPFMGEKEAKKWTPFLLSVFFFLLFLNLLSLIPYMGAPTGNINFTAAMAIMVFLVFNIAGMKANGPFNYVKGLVPAGTPAPILVILFPIEVLGLLTKTVALAIRLFANLAAGHFVIFSLLGLIVLFKKLALAPAFVGFALAIYLLEILVSFLQAYVFTLLTTLFISGAVQQDH